MGHNYFDVIVIGGGQAGLAAGYYLRRSDLRFLILDEQEEAGGAWLHTWDTLRLFSPARWSSLPGRLMPGGADYYPDRNETIAYLADYEKRYDLAIERPVWVQTVQREAGHFILTSDRGVFRCRALISATGTWRKPFIPSYPGFEDFTGESLHSAQYRSPLAFAGTAVLIVGGGNSGAQILAELAPIADCTWVTLSEPQFLPDDIDGRVLFDMASAAYRGRMKGLIERSGNPLGNIVMLPSLREARERGYLQALRPPDVFTSNGAIWPDGSPKYFDSVIWCTGFKAALDHLRTLNVIDARGRIELRQRRSVKEPRLWLLGYGGWTGFASATLVGVGRTARDVVQQITAELSLTSE